MQQIDQAFRVAALERGVMMDVLIQKVTTREFVMSSMKARASAYGLDWEERGEQNGSEGTDEQNENSLDIPGENKYGDPERYSD